MFTGIVEELGQLLELGPGPAESARAQIRGPLVTADAKLGDSISVNGICLTIADLDADVFTADVMAETLRRTALLRMSPAARVNLERALRADSRLGGHVVTGHVDATGVILDRQPSARWEVLRIGLPARVVGQVAVKGSIAVDGVSLTVTDVGANSDQSHWFEVSLIPTTLAHSTLGEAVVGSLVNLETDVLAKYVSRLLESGAYPATGVPTTQL